MKESEAKKIGSKLGLLSAGVGLLIVYVFMAIVSASDQGTMQGIMWITTTHHKLNIFVGATLLLLSGHFYGRLTGKAILIKNRNFILTGFLCGMAVLVTTAFLSGWVGFFQEGSNSMFPNENPFIDYVIKPLWWVTIFGTIPALLVGILFGAAIKWKGNKLN